MVHDDGDLLEVSMFGCDCLECRGDPFNFQRLTPKDDVFKLGYFGEVDRTECRSTFGSKVQANDRFTKKKKKKPHLPVRKQQ